MLLSSKQLHGSPRTIAPSLSPCHTPRSAADLMQAASPTGPQRQGSGN